MNLRRYHCPWCIAPISEHETRNGYLSLVYLCPNAPDGWRGLVYDQDGEVIPVPDERAV